MSGYLDRVVAAWSHALRDAEVLNDVHLVRVNATTRARTSPIGTTCTLGPDDRAVLGDQMPGQGTWALCRHMRPLIPPEVLA